MSMHLVECTGALDLPPSVKLALVAFADSADKYTRVAMPGFEAVQGWAGCSRARTYELIAELEQRGLIRQETRGRRGHRATYTVFPGGCCDLHRTVVDPVDGGDPDALEVALEALAATGIVLTDEQRQALAERVVPDSETGSGPLDPNGGDAGVSAGQEPAPEDRVRPTGPNAAPYAQTAERVQSAGPSGEKGSGKGPVQGGPLPSFEKHFPLTPSEAGGTAAGGEDNPGCRRHPAGDGRNCRACGTTARQLAAAKRAREAAARREREQAALAAAKRQRAAAAVPARRHQDTLAAARAQIAASQLDRTTVTPTGARS